jgi:hypothetical protein
MDVLKKHTSTLSDSLPMPTVHEPATVYHQAGQAGQRTLW